MFNTDGTKVGFDAKPGKVLKILREVPGKGKPNAVILPRLTAPKGTMPTVSAEDPPKHIVTWKENYAEMDPKAYAYIRAGKLKMVKECFMMGFNIEAKACISKVADDLKGMGAYFTVKPVQNIKTDFSIAFLGLSVDTDWSIVKQRGTQAP